MPPIEPKVSPEPNRGDDSIARTNGRGRQQLGRGEREMKGNEPNKNPEGRRSRAKAVGDKEKSYGCVPLLRGRATTETNKRNERSGGGGVGALGLSLPLKL